LKVLYSTWFYTGSNSEIVRHMEELLATWYRQIEQVLTESEQIRREADDVGPSAELQYWKGRMAKFNS
jgi:dynein heavy chain, axonemal